MNIGLIIRDSELARRLRSRSREVAIALILTFASGALIFAALRPAVDKSPSPVAARQPPPAK